MLHAAALAGIYPNKHPTANVDDLIQKKKSYKYLVFLKESLPGLEYSFCVESHLLFVVLGGSRKEVRAAHFIFFFLLPLSPDA